MIMAMASRGHPRTNCRRCLIGGWHVVDPGLLCLFVCELSSQSQNFEFTSCIQKLSSHGKPPPYDYTLLPLLPNRSDQVARGKRTKTLQPVCARSIILRRTGWLTPGWELARWTDT